jgi:hypothetical protein
LAISLFLIAGARPALLMNWTRPLRGPQSLLATSREVSYFADMGQWANRASYERSVDLTARSGCGLVGLDISENQLEYPFQVLLRARHAAVRFVHTGVENASARYVPAHAPQPCAVLCPDCIGNGKKLALYGSVGEPLVIGRFLLFLGK